MSPVHSHPEYERRLTEIEHKVDANAEKTNEWFRDFMQWANETFSKTQGQIVEESKAIRKEISDLRNALYGIIICSILLPILLLVLGHYIWH